MTTPERFRRRQRIEGASLILLGVLTLGYGIYDSERSSDRDQCMARSFSTSSNIQNQRAHLAQQANALQAEIDGAQNRVIQNVAAAQNTDEVIAAFTQFNHNLTHVQHQQHKLLEERRDTKIPSFPTGKCQ